MGYFRIWGIQTHIKCSTSLFLTYLHGQQNRAWNIGKSESSKTDSGFFPGLMGGIRPLLLSWGWEERTYHWVWGVSGPCLRAEWMFMNYNSMRSLIGAHSTCSLLVVLSASLTSCPPKFQGCSHPYFPLWPQTYHKLKHIRAAGQSTWISQQQYTANMLNTKVLNFFSPCQSTASLGFPSSGAEHLLGYPIQDMSTTLDYSFSLIRNCQS